ncbi:putative transcription factor GRAS family [Helianthus anomalus]
MLACARSISLSDLTTAHRIATVLSSDSSPSGDSLERLIHSFTKAISPRLPPSLSPTSLPRLLLAIMMQFYNHHILHSTI